MVDRIDPVAVGGPAAFAGRDLMSPYVWQSPAGHFVMLVRAVPKPGQDGDTGRIWAALSDDGLSFTAGPAPVLVPGPGPDDIGGCEDPTPVTLPDGTIVVFYTGVCADRTHGEMLYAVGSSLDRLEKRGIAMPNTPSQGNIKEATVDRTDAGEWQMFYEYAHEEASLIGLARGKGPAGPWDNPVQPFAPRPDAWDSWHLSTGPLYTADKDRPAMFYNGATRDARWRIGWVEFNAEYTEVTARCIEPLIVPPPRGERTETDIAFAASCVIVGEEVWLYYSIEDTMLQRAIVRRV